MSVLAPEQLDVLHWVLRHNNRVRRHNNRVMTCAIMIKQSSSRNQAIINE